MSESVSFDRDAKPVSGESSQDYQYPDQRHAGKVGYGPNYYSGPTFGDKVKGLEEEIKGKLTGNPSLVEHGKERMTGELKRKEKEHDLISNDPFAPPDEKKHPTSPEKFSTGHKDERAATTIAPHRTNVVDKHS